MEDPDDAGTCPIHHASRGGHMMALLVLLKSNVSVESADANGATPLSIAAEANQVATAAVLIAMGADRTAEPIVGPNVAKSPASLTTHETIIEMLDQPDQSEHVRSAKYNLSLMRIQFKLSSAE